VQARVRVDGAAHRRLRRAGASTRVFLTVIAGDVTSCRRGRRLAISAEGRSKETPQVGQPPLRNDHSLDALSDALLNAVRDIGETEGMGSISLHFDELDQGLAVLDEQRATMLIGLILAARDVRRRLPGPNPAACPVVYCNGRSALFRLSD
jgi:hypothetical protein